VHCDIKPENILQNWNGSDFYLADFGLSEYSGRTQARGGSFDYMAPEAWGTGAISTAADIWSFGTVLLEVVHGLPTSSDFASFEEWPQAIIHRAQADRPELLPMLREDPRERCDATRCLLVLGDNGGQQSLKRRTEPKLSDWRGKIFPSGTKGSLPNDDRSAWMSSITLDIQKLGS
jgi:serine/threonine protein kinase